MSSRRDLSAQCTIWRRRCSRCVTAVQLLSNLPPCIVVCVQSLRYWQAVAFVRKVDKRLSVFLACRVPRTPPLWICLRPVSWPSTSSLARSLLMSQAGSLPTRPFRKISRLSTGVLSEKAGLRLVQRRGSSSQGSWRGDKTPPFFTTFLHCGKQRQ